MDFVQLLKTCLSLPYFAVIESVVVMVAFLYHFHGRVFCERQDDYKAYTKHFVAVFALFFIVPLATLLIYGRNPVDFGLRIGNWRQGLLWVAGGFVVFPLVAVFSSKDPAMTRQYPFSKTAMDSAGQFVKFEAMYFLFYYTGWEFLFRGFLLFALAKVDPVLAILVQIVPSTLLHINHPESENWGAVVAGLVFGYVAYSTGSLLYPWIMHASMGILLDTAIYLRRHKTQKALWK